MTEPLHILSLGLGVQSSTLGFMAARHEINPMPVAAGFGDTKQEPKSVYVWLAEITPILPFPLYVVSKGDLKADSLQVKLSKRSGNLYVKGIIPAFILNPDGTKGILGRACTADYKIAMLVRKARQIVGHDRISAWRQKHKLALKELAKSKREKRPCDYALWREMQADALAIMWIGISTDEADRMKPSRTPWIRYRWPLIEVGMSRGDCIQWLKDNGFPVPPRSACKFCPFHSDDEWIKLRDESPEEFLECVHYERDLQRAAARTPLRGIPFLHESCILLDQVKFVPTRPGYRQVSLFKNECTGMCGV